MGRKAHPRFKRFKESLRNDWHQDLCYRREAWVFRRLFSYWASPDQMHALNRALARHFKVPAPKLVLRLGADVVTGGWFRVRDDGSHHIFCRGSRHTGWWQTRGLSDRCKHYKIKTRVHEGEYHVHTLLHEWAHYLAWKFWWHGGHDAVFCSLLEVTHEWYARRRKREARREVRWSVDVTE